MTSQREYHDLGTVYVDHHNGADFHSWEAEVYDCPGCNARLLAVYIAVMGYSSRDTDGSPCPECGDRSHRIRSATWPTVTTLATGAERITKEEADRGWDSSPKRSLDGVASAPFSEDQGAGLC